jgi:DNA-binding NarL/FixJ family response regulator
MAIRIILADDHKIVRESFRALLENVPQFQIVADVADGEAAVKAALELKPDIVVMDMTMPIMSGAEATSQILAKLPKTRIIALSMHTHPRAISAMIKAGATAFIPKTCKAAELVKAIHAVTQGKSYIAPGLEMPSDKTTSKLDAQSSDTPLTTLSHRENQILALIADGYETLDIGKKIGISGKTVASHRKHLMTKLNIGTVAELTKYAIREGISSI